MREVSHIHTAPSSRLPVATSILPWDPHAVQRALLSELQRGGQAFYVVPRIRDIPLHVEMLRDLLKGGRADGTDPVVVVAHGGLPPGEAEEVLVRFAMRGKAAAAAAASAEQQEGDGNGEGGGGGDVLVATTLIENGLDVPTVNTVVVAQAHKLGLASLYQLRGRVGRSDKQAYAYFFHPVQQRGGGGKGTGKGGGAGAGAGAGVGAGRGRCVWCLGLVWGGCGIVLGWSL
jgi:transcription-repair coupling factor (superfamily II helicase)